MMRYLMILRAAQPAEPPPPALMEGINGREPVIPFEVFDDYRLFGETGYDFVTMAQSPRYAPASADRIMALLEPYILPVKG